VGILEKRVYRFIKEHSLFAPASLVLVAFSGGPDSTALAELLYRLRSSLNVELLLLHVNHMLRGEESERDEAFCLHWARERGISIVVERRNVQSVRKSQKLSLEEAARLVRYEVFKEYVEKEGASCVALGHTYEDQVETVLMNIIRGTGLFGLSGMLPKEGIYVRPLLSVRRKEIREFLTKEGISFVEDSSNLDLSFLRNKIRHVLLPLLGEVNPRVSEAIFRLSLNAREVTSCQRAPSLPIVRTQNALCVDLDVFLLASPGERELMVRHFLKEARGTLWDITRSQIESIVRLVEKRKGEVFLPGKMQVFVNSGRLWASPSPLPLVEIPPFCFPLELPGTSLVPELGLVIEGGFLSPSSLEKRTVWQTAMDSEKCVPPFYLRNFREGDRIVWAGKKRKVKELFEEFGIIREWRRLLPFLCDQEKILWMPGLALDERVRVQENSKSILYVRMWKPKG